MRWRGPVEYHCHITPSHHPSHEMPCFRDVGELESVRELNKQVTKNCFFSCKTTKAIKFFGDVGHQGG